MLDVRWIPEVPDSGPVLSVESAFGLVPPTGPWGEEKTMWSERCPLQSSCVVHHEVESLAGNDVVVENSLQLKLLKLLRRRCHWHSASVLLSVPGGLSRNGTAIDLGRENYPRTTLCIP